MNGHDFVYKLEKQRILELAMATRGSSARTSGSSYNRIAYNVFRSLYPPEQGKFSMGVLGWVNAAKHYVDATEMRKNKADRLDRAGKHEEEQKVIAKIKDPDLDPIERQEIEDLAGNEAANKKAGQLAGRIWRRVKDYIATHPDVTDAMVQSWLLDPENKIGQEILSGIKEGPLSAQIVGIEGQPVTGWSKELWSGESAREQEVAPEEKPKPKRSAADVLNAPSKQQIVRQYKGRSVIPEENRKYFTEFIKKVLVQAHKSGILKTIALTTRGRGGRTSGSDISAYEFATTQAVRPIITAIAYNFADIAVRALIEFELIHAQPDFEPDWSQVEIEAIKEPELDFSDDADKDDGDEITDITDIKHKMYRKMAPVPQEDIKSYANQIFDKIKDQMELSGVKILPATIQSMAKSWVKTADNQLKTSGFDDRLGEELEYYKNRLTKTPPGETFKLSAKVKQAIENTTEDIAANLYHNNEFIKTFVEFLIDSEEIKKLLRKLDPTVGERETEIEKVKKATFKRFIPKMTQKKMQHPVGESFSQYIKTNK